MKKPDIINLLSSIESAGELESLGMAEDAADFIMGLPIIAGGYIEQLNDAAIQYQKLQSAPKKCVLRRKVVGK